MYRKNSSLRILVFALMLALSGCAGTSSNTSNTAVNASGEGIHTDLEGMELNGISFENSKGLELLKVCNSSRVDVKKMRALIESGVDVNARIEIDGQYLTPLGVVCNRSDIDAKAVRVLLELGADVNATSLTPFNRHRDVSDKYEATPLALACDRSNIDSEAISLLLKHGAKLDDGNYTMLDIVCSRSKIDIKAIRTLVSHGADINAYSNKSGKTPILTACNRSEIDDEALRVLIELGADINLGTKSNNDTAVMVATDRNNFDKSATALLLDSGADVNIRAQNGTDLLSGIIRDLDLTKRVIDMGANIHSKDNHGTSFFHYAASWGTPETISYVLGLGFNINIKSKNGSTPLHLAAYGNTLEAIQLLVDSGANIYATDNNNMNALMCACAKKRKQLERVTTIQPDVVKYLIDQGLDVNQADKEGWTALFYAGYAASQDDDTSKVIEMLLDAGADLSHADTEGKIVLDYVENENTKNTLLSRADNSVKLHGQLFNAVNAKDMSKIRSLIDAGANVNEQDKYGRTPIWYASTIEIAKYLIEHGADLNSLDKYHSCLVTHSMRPRYSNHNGDGHSFTKEDRTDLVIFLMEQGAKPGKGDLDEYYKRKELSLSSVTGWLEFTSESQWDKFRKLYVTEDTVNLPNGGIGTPLLYDLLHDPEGFPSPYRLSQDPEEIIHLLDLGARLDCEHCDNNMLAEYLGRSSIQQSKEVVRKFLDIIPANYEGREILNAYYGEFNQSLKVPVLILMIQKFPEFVQEMIDKGTDPNAETVRIHGMRTFYADGHETYQEGITHLETALMAAVAHPDIVEALIKAGANVNATTSSGDTALKIAKAKKYTQTVKLLLKAGAK